MTTTTAEREATGVPGGDAERPTEIPARGWFQIAKRGWAEAKTDQVPLLAAGVAFKAFLALFPALLALVLIYGLVADPSTIASQVGNLTSALPADARSLITDQLQSLSANSGKAGIGAVVSILIALWSTSGGVGNMVTAVNIAYDEDDDRSFVKKRLIALALTVGAIVFMVLMLALVAAVPAILTQVDNSLLEFGLQAVRWILTVVVISAALAVLYRVAPDRDAPKMRWVSVGAAVATVLWLIASVGFSQYVAHFGKYAKTYGALAGVVVVLLWLWLTCYAILLGAEINAEAEQQTVADSTTGPAVPIGERGAVKADSVPDESASEQTEDRSTGDRSAEDEHPSSAQSAKESVVSDDVESLRPRSAAPADQSIGQLVGQISQDSSQLVRDEFRLAKAELSASAKKIGIGVGAFAAAAVLALFGLGALVATAILALALVLPGWLAALIVAVVILVIAGIAALVGKGKVSAGAAAPQQSVQSVKEDVAVIKESASHE